MTLHEWEDRSPIAVLTHENGARYVPGVWSLAAVLLVFLHDLSDYRVSSVTGGTAWLGKK
jgi:hypothetical protein